MNRRTSEVEGIARRRRWKNRALKEIIRQGADLIVDIEQGEFVEKASAVKGHCGIPIGNPIEEDCIKAKAAGWKR